MFVGVFLGYKLRLETGASCVCACACFYVCVYVVESMSFRVPLSSSRRQTAYGVINTALSV